MIYEKTCHFTAIYLVICIYNFVYLGIFDI